MSVRPHPTKAGAWRIDIRPDGRAGHRERHTYIGTEADAILMEAELLRGSRAVIRTNPTLAAKMPEFYDSKKLEIKKSTLGLYVASWKFLAPYFGHLPVSRITQIEIDRFAAARRSKPRTCQINLDHLFVILRWMQERGYASDIGRLKKPSIKYQRPIPVVPSADTYRLIRAQIHDEAKGIMLDIMYGAGLRWNEVAQLRWTEFDAEAGTVLLLNTKTGRQRYAVLPDAAVKWLKKKKPKTDKTGHILSSPSASSAWIFPNPRTGKPYGSLKKILANACERAGAPRIKGVHKLRHAAGAAIYGATGSVKDVALILGHQSLEMANWYSQVNLEAQREIMRKVRVHTRNAGHLGHARNKKSPKKTGT